MPEDIAAGVSHAQAAPSTRCTPPRSCGWRRSSNAVVYALFDLTTAEIKLIEESTKYRYGEV